MPSAKKTTKKESARKGAAKAAKESKRSKKAEVEEDEDDLDLGDDIDPDDLDLDDIDGELDEDDVAAELASDASSEAVLELTNKVAGLEKAIKAQTKTLGLLEKAVQELVDAGGAAPATDDEDEEEDEPEEDDDDEEDEEEEEPPKKSRGKKSSKKSAGLTKEQASKIVAYAKKNKKDVSAEAFAAAMAKALKVEASDVEELLNEKGLVVAKGKKKGQMKV